MTATASSNGRSVRLKKSINVPNGQAREVNFDFGRLDVGVWEVVVAADTEDDLVSDNTRVTAFEIARPASVLIFDGSPSVQDQAELT